MAEQNRFGCFQGIVLGIVTSLVASYIYGNVVSPQTDVVPEVRNLPLKEAETRLVDAHLVESVTWADGGVKDQVVQQEPLPGLRWPRGSPVKLWVQIGKGEVLAPVTSPAGHALTVRNVMIPTDYIVAVKLPDQLSVNGSTDVSTAEGQLDQPIQIASDVVAAKGARVTIDVLPVRGTFPSVRLVLREVRQTDGRTLNVRTNKIVRDSETNAGTLVGSVIICVMFGLLAGIALWVLILVTTFIPLGPELLGGTMFLGFLLGLATIPVIIGASAVTIPADTVLQFHMSDTTFASMYNGG